MNEFKKVCEVVELLRATSSTNDKIEIIKSNEGNELFKKVLQYAYNGDKYNISKATLKKPLCGVQKGDIFDICDLLARSNINKKLKTYVLEWLGYVGETQGTDVQDLFACVLGKDLRCNINSKLINKAIPNLIYTFDIQQAAPMAKLKLKKNEKFFLMKKLNGERAVLYKDSLRTRQNNIFMGVGHIIRGLDEINEIIYKEMGHKLVFDGELLHKNAQEYGIVSEDENFRRTVALAHRKEDNDKLPLEIVLFDVLPINEFEQGQSQEPFKERVKALNIIKQLIKHNNIEHVRVVGIDYYGDDTSKIDEVLDFYDGQGSEGAMLMKEDSKYQCKRHTGIVKLKRFKSSDLKIIGFVEGNGKLEGTLGSLIVEYKGNPVGVGGYTDEMRDYLWNNKDVLLGRVAEVKYKAESQDENGKLSLQFPTFVCLREEGKEVSYE